MDPVKIIDNLMEVHKPVLGKDYVRYRNHVSRVFLNCQLLDPSEESREKYAIAAVYHDIGIWTDHTFDYLEPSIAEAKKYLAGIGKSEWTEEISKMIYWHHKIKPYKGDFERTTETFRKADWIDVSLGLLSYGGDKKTMAIYRSQFPNRGFHFFLVKQAAKNFLKHPLNPIPVFKK
ncbi:MAG TPA: HD domain-containing protein [Pseudobacter sp.]|nr:HD domain-containing protein [Pseudobacter sp.]